MFSFFVGIPGIVRECPGGEILPHLIFSLRTSDAREGDGVGLTNYFLVGKPGLENPTKACLGIPVSEGESNVVLNFSVQNNSTVPARDLQTVIALPEAWACLAGPMWHEVDPFPFFSTKGKGVQSWWISAWGALPPGDRANFPPLTITRPVTNSPGFLSVWTQTADSTNLLVMHAALFPARPDFLKPVVVLGIPNSDGTRHFSFSPRELRELQK